MIITSCYFNVGDVSMCVCVCVCVCGHASLVFVGMEFLFPVGFLYIDIFLGFEFSFYYFFVALGLWIDSA